MVSHKKTGTGRACSRRQVTLARPPPGKVGHRKTVIVCRFDSAAATAQAIVAEELISTKVIAAM